jgi:hypothetical protein
MMTGIVTSTVRMGFVIVVGAIMAIATSGEAAAKHREAHLRHANGHHRMFAESRAEVLPHQPARLGAMRYYGGPKSPMWRGPAESEVSAKPVLVVQQQPARLGQMRYYGGPKSPMWRGPVEN